jgi:hypothetical protein
MPDFYHHAAQIDRQATLPPRFAVTNHHARPGKAGNAVRTLKEAREALNLALHVLRAALANQL